MTRAKRKSVDEGELARVLANRYWLPVKDVEAARAALKLRPNDFAIRFTDFVLFANEFGLDVRAFAKFIAANTSGIKRWVSKSKYTSAEYERVRKVVPGGDWVATILQLLDRLEKQDGT